MKLNKLPLSHLPKGAGNSSEGKAAWRIGAFFLLMLALTLFSRGMAGAAHPDPRRRHGSGNADPDRHSREPERGGADPA